MPEKRLLIANRGEIALRVQRTASELGYATVAVHGADDADGLHVRRADQAVLLPGHGPRAYLDAAAVVAAVASAVPACTPAVSWRADFAAGQAGRPRVVGPTPTQLALFGDSSPRAAARARRPGAEASAAVDDPPTQAFAMPRVAASSEGRRRRWRTACGARTGQRCRDLWRQAAAEAAAAFGDGRVYAEHYVARARPSKSRSWAAGAVRTCGSATVPSSVAAESDRTRARA